jgi:hypothetical protein
MKSKRHHLYRALSLVLLTLSLGAAGCKSNGNKSVAQPAVAAKPGSVAKPSPPPHKRLISEGGWKIPGLAGAKEFIPPKLIQSASNESVKVYTSWLRPTPRATAPITLREYFLDEQIKELGITAKRLMVEVIVKYDVGGRPFCYVVKYRARYAVEALHFYDEDGDKDFELVETGTAQPTFTPRIPNWAQASK